LPGIDPEKTYDRNKEGMIFILPSETQNIKVDYKEEGKGKIRINFKKQQSKFHGRENPGIVPDRSRSASLCLNR
jgi:hypothetical protein